MKWVVHMITACYALLVVLFCWYLLSSDDSDWLQVETPSRAFNNHSFDIRVTLIKPETGMFLKADLHWMNDKKVSGGYLSGSKPVEIIDNKTVYTLSLPIPPVKHSEYIFPVIFLSPDGTWETRTAAASINPVPVHEWEDDKSFLSLKQNRARDISEHKAYLQTESVKLRFIVACIWLVIALISFRIRRRLKTWWITVAALISAVWEALDVNTALESTLRYITLHAEVYSNRKEPQQILTIIIVIAFAGLIFYMISYIRKSEKFMIWIFLSVFWGVSLLHIISLHEIDTILSKTITGLEIGQLIRFAASLACLAAIAVFPASLPDQSDTDFYVNRDNNG